jgi:GH35 family endo-1,4-beta-xylanase
VIFWLNASFQTATYTELVQEQFAEKYPETPVTHRNAFNRLIEKFREIGSVLDDRGHHFQHLLQVHSDFPNALYNHKQVTRTIFGIILVVLEHFGWGFIALG